MRKSFKSIGFRRVHGKHYEMTDSIISFTKVNLYFCFLVIKSMLTCPDAHWAPAPSLQGGALSYTCPGVDCSRLSLRVTPGSLS